MERAVAMNPTTPIPPVLVQHVCFHAWKRGIMTEERERGLQEDVAAQVTVWLNTHAQPVSILNVSTAQTSLGAYATVWYTPQP
jgi:hypothetical protein